jgi:DNA-binding phage protein
VAELKVLKNKTFLELRNIGEIMKEVKTQRSRSYREYLISSLKDTEHAAAYIGVMLELDEEGFEPELLRSALKEVMEAREQMNNLSEEAKLHYEKLDKILLETKAAELYSLIEFLDALGFRLAIVPKD